MSLIGAAWIPGLPFVLKKEASLEWAKLAQGMEELSRRLEELKPDTIVLYSTQWFSVLGTSFQKRVHLEGVHIDENWYEWGDLPFKFSSDVTLSEKFESAVAKVGIPTKGIDYEEFPIDTGTVVANRFLNPQGKIPLSLVSSWVYATPEKSQLLGQTMRKTIEESGKRVFVVASSLLSTRFFTDEINPKQDHISNAEDTKRDQELKTIFERWDLEKDLARVTTISKEMPLDMQFNAFHWLRGILGPEKWKGETLAFGPQWGAGALVTAFTRGAKP